MRMFALLTLLMYLGLTSPTAQAQNKKNIDLSVLPPETIETIYKNFPSIQDGSFKREDLDNLIKYLIITEQYDYSHVQQSQGNYFLSVGRTRRINEVEFTGFKSISESEIMREFGIAEKSVFDQNLLVDAAERVRRLYLERGFPSTLLDLEFTRLSKSDIKVLVKITEGVQTLITRINIVSDNPKLKSIIEKNLKKMSGEPLTNLTLNEIRSITREYFSENRYYRAELVGPAYKISKDESAAELTYKIERPEKFYLDYTGLENQWRFALENSIELETFFSTNPNIGGEIANKIKNNYQKDGYARVEVAHHETEISPFEKKIQFTVTEGPRVRIEEIEINGKFSLNKDYYVDFIKTHSSDLISNGYYHRDELDLGLKNLIVDRQNSGFLKARIISTRTTYNKRKDGVTIYVNLDEGPQTFLDTIAFKGVESFSEEQLLAVIKVESGKPLRLNQLEEAISNLKSFYKNRGYLEMSLLNELDGLVQYSEDSSKAQLLFHIQEGPQIYVASIVVEGNSLTQDYVIYNELEFSVGDILTPALIDDSVSRLQRLGHFSNVDIKTLEEKTQLAQRTVVIRVTDRDPGLFTLGIGANNERRLTLRGYIGMSYRNISGTGRGVYARLEGNYNVTDVKYLERKVTLGYLEPYLFNTRLRGRLNLSRSVAVSDFDSRTASEVNQTTYSVEYDLSKHMLLSYDLWSLAQVRDFAIDPDNTTFTPTELNIASTGPTLEVDHRNHPFNPTQGTFSRISLEYSAPTIGSSSNIEYIKALASITHYMGFRRGSWVWANSFRTGFLQNLSKDGGVPYDKKGLILGGQSTIRGYQPGEAFPNAFELGTDRYSLETEAKMFLVKSELRFPIYGNFGGAVFYDGGAVLIQGVDFEDPYRDSVGIAFRYNTPVGAVSLEWGYKLDYKKERGESQLPFHFSIGTF